MKRKPQLKQPTNYAGMILFGIGIYLILWRHEYESGLALVTASIPLFAYQEKDNNEHN